MLTIYSFGKQTGCRRLSGSPWTAENIGLADSIAFDRIDQRFGNVGLTNDFFKGLGTPFP
jgi:hypothetical protein